MADVSMGIEWGEQPFAFGPEDGDTPAWPGPLVRPERWQPGWDEAMHGPKVTIPDELLNRWLRVQAELLEVQAELRRHAREQGDDDL